jgi:hypothetical protein
LAIPTLDFSASAGPVDVWGTSDWHLGSKDHDAERFERHLERAVEGGWHLLHVGDALELVTPSSRVAQRGALREQVASPEEQRKLLVAALKRLRGQGFLLPGNHEFRIDAATGLDFVASITDAVGDRIRPLDRPQRVRLLVGSQTYDVYLHHGEGPAISPTTLFDRLQRDEEGLDVILAGHIHSTTLDAASVGSPNGHRNVLRLRTGHYLVTPAYQLVKPIARRGAPGSWLLRFYADEHRIDPVWLS